MKLVSDIEAMIRIIEKEKGSFIFTQDNIPTAKERYEHFLIVHTFAPDNWYDKMIEVHGFDCLSNKKTKKAIKSLEEELKDLSDKNAEKEIEEEEAVAAGEIDIEMKNDDVTRLVARSRKITVHSEVQLNDNGWFLVPVYEGMDGLYPMMFKVLPKKKGFQLFISKVPLAPIPVNTFDDSNTGNWKYNSMFTVDRLLEQEQIFNMRCYSIIKHRKEPLMVTMLRKLLSQFDYTQHSRIKQGNILIDEVLTTVGQSAYVSNKENLSKKKKGQKADEEVSKYDLADIKIIDEIMKGYKRINDLAKEEGKEIATTATFNNIRAKLKNIEEEEENETVSKYIREHEDEYPPEKDMTPEEIQAVKESIHTLNSTDYINSHLIYTSCVIYETYLKNEAKAEKSLKRALQDIDIWTEILEHEKGVGPVIAARIIAAIDFNGTNHPSSVIKFAGLDQVIIRPDRSEDVEMSQKEFYNIVCMLHKDWQIINYNTTLEGMPELDINTYDIKYKSDCLPTYNSYLVATKAFTDMEAKKILQIEDLLGYPGFKIIVEYIWKNLIIDEKMTADGPDYVVRKRARNKSDKTTTTYIDTDGKVKVKGGIGYNAKLKSSLLFLLSGSLLKANNETYSSIYNDIKQRLRQKYINLGVDPEGPGTKKHIHNMASRTMVQKFIENLWISVRKLRNLPLNGGTYYEGKIMGRHLHGIDPALFKN